jgi:hypothetical protein
LNTFPRNTIERHSQSFSQAENYPPARTRGVWLFFPQLARGERDRSASPGIPTLLSAALVQGRWPFAQSNRGAARFRFSLRTVAHAS